MTLIAGLQGGYFLATGLWPLFHIASFLKVTGPKKDIWLVKTVGALMACIGITLLSASFTGQVTGEIVLLGLASALTLASVDLYYSGVERISKIYLLDAVIEIALVMWWIYHS